MIPAHVIEKKREGESIDPGTLRAFLIGYLDGVVEEYQMSAFLMAVLFRGLDPAELDTLVDTMIGSGGALDLGTLERPRVDKHSTGGVGDKVSLALAPLAAELGLYVPMMSGRGLGHSGGTLDKLEAIPGFRTDLDLERFHAVLGDIGCAMIGQTAEIAPLDRRLYDLRSVTGTVPAIPLISASIMSKKLAEDLTALVLDVKVGSGAFLPDEGRALTLARTMVAIGTARGVRTEAWLTAMDRPLGCAVGNGLETVEALECLAGAGPDDVRALVVHLAASMVQAGGDATSLAELRRRAATALDDGSALRRMERLVEAQGGDPRIVTEPTRIARAPETAVVEADRSGVVVQVEPRALGDAVVAMGGGRVRLGEAIDPRVGFRVLVRPGDRVMAGDPLAEVHAADAGGMALGA
ncbi:MAG: thymidine phosphorylase, partial [Gemmatimonadetes bacterium]|nr:thymidine phosphorylase [Gemmatimonadota bacterium]